MADAGFGYALAVGELPRAAGLFLAEVTASQGRHTATFVWPWCDLRRAQLPSGARSSAGQSSCLLSSGSRVRILPGALTCGFACVTPLARVGYLLGGGHRRRPYQDQYRACQLHRRLPVASRDRAQADADLESAIALREKLEA